jgi:protein TonB
MSRTFKLALAASLLVHAMLFVVARLITNGEGQPKEMVTLPVIAVLVPVQEDFIPTPTVEISPRPIAPETPVAPPPTPVAAPPKVEPPVVIQKPEPPPLEKSTPQPAPTPAVEVPAPKPSPIVVTAPASTISPTVPNTTPTTPAPATAAKATNETVATTPIAAAPALITGRVKYRHAPDPEYPALARRRRQEGVVLLAVTIAPGGLPTDVRVKQSSSFPALDRAAVEAVQHWEFDVNTTAPVRAEVPVRFQLVK